MRHKIIVLLFACLLFGIVARAGFSETISPMDSEQREKIADIHKLLTMTHASENAILMMNQMFSGFKKSIPQVPQSDWDMLQKEMESEVRVDDLINQIIPIYDKYYTLDDIKALIRFYESPIGQKSIAVLPKISQESLAVGQTWGIQVAQKILKKLEQKGYKSP